MARETAERPLAEAAASLLRRERPLEVDTVYRLGERVVSLYRGLCCHPDVVSVQGHARLYEVAFTVFEPSPAGSDLAAGSIVTGTIDCLARSPDGEITVLEFKTGQPRPEHDAQIEHYVRAARLMFPEAKVAGRLVYPA